MAYVEHAGGEFLAVYAQVAAMAFGGPAGAGMPAEDVGLSARHIEIVLAGRAVGGGDAYHVATLQLQLS